MAITYRPDEDTKKQIEKLKSILGISTTTKLLDYLISTFEDDQKKYKKLQDDNFELDREFEITRRSIDKFISSFDDLRSTNEHIKKIHLIEDDFDVKF